MSRNPITLHLNAVVHPVPRPRPVLRLVSELGSRRTVTESGVESGPSDAQLVALLRAGHSEAFEALYRRHAAFVLNLAVRVQGTAADVEDLVHDAFLKAHERIDALREPSAFRPWLGSIIVMQVRARLRRRRFLGSLGLGYGEAIELDAIASPQAGPDARAQLAQVYALLQTLATDDRIAWTLRVIERQSLEDVARLSQCSLATAKRRIARAQRFLNEHFVAAFGEEGS